MEKPRVSKKKKAVEMMQKVMNGESYMQYNEIARVCGYHPKYLLKLKRDLLNNDLKYEHGNTNRKPKNTITEEEKQYIISLYKRSHGSIRKFCRFYGKRSYSCIWHVLKEAGLI